MSQRVIVTFIVSAALVPVCVASGAETTKGEFVRQANAICRQELPRANRLGKRSVKLARQGRLAAAGRLLVRVGRIYLRSAARIAAIPRPSQIAAEVKRLLDNVRAGSRLLIRAGRALVRQELRKAVRLLNRADRHFKVANRLSLRLGLGACGG